MRLEGVLYPSRRDITLNISIYFMDDLNMPEVDKYGTASPHTILRQFFDYRHWYDRQKLSLKEIHNCQLVACMNPTVCREAVWRYMGLDARCSLFLHDTGWLVQHFTASAAPLCRVYGQLSDTRELAAE